MKFKNETLQTIQTFFNREIIYKFDYIIIHLFSGILSNGYKKKCCKVINTGVGKFLRHRAKHQKWIAELAI